MKWFEYTRKNKKAHHTTNSRRGAVSPTKQEKNTCRNVSRSLPTNTRTDVLHRDLCATNDATPRAGLRGRGGARVGQPGRRRGGTEGGRGGARKGRAEGADRRSHRCAGNDAAWLRPCQGAGGTQHCSACHRDNDFAAVPSRHVRAAQRSRENARVSSRRRSTLLLPDSQCCACSCLFV